MDEFKSQVSPRGTAETGMMSSMMDEPAAGEIDIESLDFENDPLANFLKECDALPLYSKFNKWGLSLVQIVSGFI